MSDIQRYNKVKAAWYVGYSPEHKTYFHIEKNLYRRWNIYYSDNEQNYEYERVLYLWLDTLADAKYRLNIWLKNISPIDGHKALLEQIEQ